MAASSGGERCKFCRRGEGLHHEGCPSFNGTTAEWQEGYRFGFDDNYIESWWLRHYTATFLMGYRAGKAEIDRLVEIAYERCYGLEYDEE